MLPAATVTYVNGDPRVSDCKVLNKLPQESTGQRRQYPNSQQA